MDLLGYMFNFLRKCQTVFAKQLHHFTSPPTMYESISPHPHPHWFLSVFLITAILDSVKWHRCGFDLHFFNVVEHSFICLLTLCTAFLVNCLFKSFALFKMGLSFHCWVVQVFSFSELVPDSYMTYTIFLPISVGCLFTLLTVFFEAQIFLILLKFNLPIFSFAICVYWYHLQETIA